VGVWGCGGGVRAAAPDLIHDDDTPILCDMFQDGLQASVSAQRAALARGAGGRGGEAHGSTATL